MHLNVPCLRLTERFHESNARRARSAFCKRFFPLAVRFLKVIWSGALCFRAMRNQGVKSALDSCLGSCMDKLLLLTQWGTQSIDRYRDHIARNATRCIR